MTKAVAILEVMWDWHAMTSDAGYEETAPRYYTINPNNLTGKRLYNWLGHNDLLVTNACPQLVSSASGRGKPDPKWLAENLSQLEPFELLLVCGAVAQKTYNPRSIRFGVTRVIAVPHPAARMWTKEALQFTKRIIQNGKHSLQLRFKNGRIVAKELGRN